ncbi:rna-dependent rna polymerase [Ophiostoma piceae UAMH 11346]|uniref:RNA-dependent RNA polymerase n=1 Tax=Ophiostoma piceae (strain UAMH 11346) TaxID=1262450 RepID=S3C5L6_OPHP1|nr:rna-dependent rna polymerase [Ophiostoma piceae UAMH 11346]
MEVFLHGLPEQGSLSDRVIKMHLQPHMQTLGIDQITYDVEKAARKRYAFVTFLYPKDGSRFVEKFSVNTKTSPGLILLGARVTCKISDRNVHPLTVRLLEADVKNSKAAAAQAAAAAKLAPAAKAPSGTPSAQTAQTAQPPQLAQPSAPATTTAASKAADTTHAPSSTAISFTCTGMHCGYYKYDVTGKLLFVPEYTEPQGKNRGVVRFGKRMLSIERKGSGVSIYIPLMTVHEIVWSPGGTMAFTLTSVPIFVSTPGSTTSAPVDKRIRLTAINNDHAKIVGMCLVYCLELVPDEDLIRKISRLSKHIGGVAVTRYDLTFAWGSDIAHREKSLRDMMLQVSTSNSLPFALLLQLQALVNNGYLHPDTVWGLTRSLVAVHRKTPISNEAMKKLFQAINWPTPHYHDPTEFDVPALVEYLVETEREIKEGLMIREGINNPASNLTPVFRAVVTPTRMTLHGPELENRNRVLRKFPNHHDYFVRVQFCDEDGQGLRFNSRIDLAKVYDRFRRIMIEGINIAGRTYKFLGWSHSSLRAHSMWFVAPFLNEGSLQTHFTIISALGNFNDIQSPARCAARIGQAFSETPFAVPVERNGIAIYQIPDVTTPDKERVYSDGVGTISWEAVKVILSHLPAGKRKAYPTCFQIRYAGAKGMLSLDTSLNGKQIRLRPSMIKFESNEKANLEICDMASQPIPLYTNRQLIKIMEDMGVPESWFVKLQEAALKELKYITKDSYNMANFLKAQGVASAIKLHKVLLLADRLLLDYRNDPFLRRATDAIVLRELRLLKHKARMFVHLGITLFGVMDETGLLGEHEVYVTYTTKKGSKSQRYSPPPVHGAKLLVTRSPALHPGDIQMATNVIPPEGHPLYSLTNCIVFSKYGGGNASPEQLAQTGKDAPRDLPSKLSGGDLDGDIFNVIWDPEVIDVDPPLDTFYPADYPRQRPASIGRPVTQEDIADFFIDFIKTDHLGAIATRHMILADQLENGTLESKCIATAELHSTAVDFSKTGIPADLRNLPKVKYRPDFLSPGPIVHIYSKADINMDDFLVDNANEEDEGDGGFSAPAYKFYPSDKILGTLYRTIDERQVWVNDIQRPPEQFEGLDLYGAFLKWATYECANVRCYEWQHRRSEAQRIRSAYDDAIINTMHEFSEYPTQPLTELEVFIGTIINKTGAQTLRQRDRSRKLRDEYERISGWITTQIRPRTASDDETADGDDESRTGQETWYKQHLRVLELCLACAYCPQEQREWEAQRKKRGARKDKDEETIESFWLVAASALIRELEFIRHGLEVDVDLANSMQTLGF